MDSKNLGKVRSLHFLSGGISDTMKMWERGKIQYDAGKAWSHELNATEIDFKPLVSMDP